MSEKFKKAVMEAQEAVAEIKDENLKKAGFEIVLSKILEGKSAEHTFSGGDAEDPEPSKLIPKNGKVNKTGLTEEELNTLFEIKEDKVLLKLTPPGKTIPEQQQAVAHAVLVGYLALQGQDAVLSQTLAASAHDWNILNGDFSRNIQKPGYIQSKGKSKGVKYSLKPGAVNKLKESLQKMARGE